MIQNKVKIVYLSGSNGNIGKHIRVQLEKDLRINVYDVGMDGVKNPLPMNFDNAAISYFVHCIGPSSIPFLDFTFISRMLLVNKKFLNSALLLGSKAFILISTSKVEDYTPKLIDQFMMLISTKLRYKIYKYKQEFMIKNFCESNGVKLHILRPPYVFGTSKCRLKKIDRMKQMFAKFGIDLHLNYRFRAISIYSLVSTVIRLIHDDASQSEIYTKIDDQIIEI